MQIARGWIQKRAHLTPTATALIEIESGRRWSYAQLMQQIASWQALFEQRGIRPGERVAILAYNCIDYFSVLFACEASGYMFVPLNWRLHPNEIQQILDDCKPSILLYDEAFKETATNLIALHKHFLQVETTTNLFAVKEHTMNCWMIIYTGGTTGKPKGVMLSYEAVNCNAVNTIISWHLHGGDCTVNYMPLFHTGGLNALAIPLLLAGGTVVIGQKFQAIAACEALDTYGATIALFVPTMYQEMVATDYFKQTHFPSMNVFLSGGAPCPQSIYDHFTAKNLNFKEGYGLTEAGPNNFYISPEIAALKKGSVGKSMLLNDVKIVTEDGLPCGVNEVGQLFVKGDHVFTAYWENELETANTFVDGWLKTGDLARMDEEGDLYIVGRAKDMIISGGENVYPQEIETCISQHPAVVNVAVVGAKDEYWGEAVTAFIVANEQTPLLADDITAYCCSNLSKYKVPKKIIFVDDLPKTSVGKIDKKALMALC